MHWRRYATKDIPEDEAQFQQWLYDRFVEKDKLIAHFYESGEFESIKQVEAGIGLRHYSEIADLWTPFLALILLGNDTAFHDEIV